MHAVSIQRANWFSIEHHAPSLAALAAAVCFAWKGERFYALAATKGWSVENLYHAGFDTSTLFAIFLFTFYGMVAAPSGGFIGAIRNTDAFREFKDYLIRAIIASAFTAVLSLPLIVTQPTSLTFDDAGFWYVAGWFSSVVWTMVAFARGVWLFVQASKVPERTERDAEQGL